jgi:hypothetical protein
MISPTAVWNKEEAFIKIRKTEANREASFDRSAQFFIGERDVEPR